MPANPWLSRNSSAIAAARVVATDGHGLSNLLISRPAGSGWRETLFRAL
jgi:hypothetical protein